MCVSSLHCQGCLFSSLALANCLAFTAGVFCIATRTSWKYVPSGSGTTEEPAGERRPSETDRGARYKITLETENVPATAAWYGVFEQLSEG
jgi:hypothetical protein